MAREPLTDGLYRGSCLEPTARVSHVGESRPATPGCYLTIGYISNINNITINSKQKQQARATLSNPRCQTSKRCRAESPPGAAHAFEPCTRRAAREWATGMPSGRRGIVDKGATRLSAGIFLEHKAWPALCGAGLSLPACIIFA